MRCIVQVFSGSWEEPSYTNEEILRRLAMLTARMTVDKVILGWYPDAAFYRPIGEYLRRKGIDMVLWLPVFAELQDRIPMKESLDAWGHPLAKAIERQGESFVFCCPTDEGNLQAVTQVFDRDFADAGFTGVFLDRVRTPSFVGGVEGVLSCGCDRCREAYRRHGVELADVTAAFEREGDRFFDADSESLRRFLQAKQAILTESIASLCRAFKARGLTVGLDVFAPSLSAFVGQSLPSLAEAADFLKPMLYRRTYAPAGIGYEYDLLRRCAPTAKGYPAVVTDDEHLRRELNALEGLPCAVYPGIEVNRLEGIAPTDAAYVRESLRVLEESGVDGVTLSWNVMAAPDAHLPFAFD